ncbi:exonuclease domain-containing protein [Croceimicrobium hydrocarbonivorans]|uniref:GIY-YIG nuclease family protein n=1 Tax=Croceimicrobium hydrocarbonivorans TaxID=2761580 RepID=A0A7H0VEI6_9FLAO|nr:exonuclease domain-containing protein [Croceimicrobium hydrocarbonivorans]QNR24134.1 GIY-YIG nuclease family protein [Croceimicrobium hydrocarbonivorans]
MFAVVDIETTGSYARGNGITEIAIYITDGLEIKDTYSTLLNPGQSIPFAIQQLTGIDDSMVADAPTFAEKAEEIREFLADHVFVAHNVSFDLGFVQAAFKEVGVNYNPRRLCTVRYSRRIIPGLRSYSLSSLCKHFNYNNQSAHRAWADTEVTTKILHQLLAADTAGIWQNMIKLNQGELNLPANLPADEFHNLPMAAGVYYFYNEKGEILYIGKASRLKSRVASHFTADKSSARSAAFKRDIAHIHYRLCGNILVAGLLEDHEIRRYWPPHNRAQKSPKLRFGVFAYRNQNADWCLGINRIGGQQAFIAKFHSLEKARTWLAEIVEERNLDPNRCGFPKGSGDTADDHNAKVEALMAEMQSVQSAMLWIGAGRTEEEQSFVYMDSQGFQGIGFVPREQSIERAEHIEPYLERLNKSASTEGILKEGWKKLTLKQIELPEEIQSNGLLF